MADDRDEDEKLRITQPGYRKGMPPGNKDRKWPAQPLTQDEIALLFDGLMPAHTRLGKRNRAMVGLMYRAEVKIGRVLSLTVADFDTETGALNLGCGRTATLDLTARGLLDDWIASRKGLRLRGASPLFCSVSGPTKLGNPLYPAYVRHMLIEVGRKQGIQKRVNPESLRVSRRAHRAGEAGRFEATVSEYVNADAFRRRYPDAYRAWLDAHRLLETSASRSATQIGHLCREAIQLFSDELVRRFGVGPFEANKTKNKIRAVLDAHEGTSKTVAEATIALANYWDKVNDLVQRQEHGPVKAEDSRRAVFLTMFLMREVDLAVGTT